MMTNSLPSAAFNASPADINAVHDILMAAGLRGTELFLMIKNFALYHSHVISHRIETRQYPAGGAPTFSATHLCSQPVPANTTPLDVTCALRSADRGPAALGGSGHYTNSHTWWDASIIVPLRKNSGRFTIALCGPFEPGQARPCLREVGWDFRFRGDGEVGWRVRNKRVDARRGERLPRRLDRGRGSWSC
ncbi:hypothetical protein SLS57_010020 [Botryosphaeria dothidea]